MVVKKINLPFINKVSIPSILAFLSFGLLVSGGILTWNLGNRIYWQTATQTSLVGFNIYRADSKEGSYEVLNDGIIPVEGDRLSGFRYEFLDRDVSSNKVYYYWIEIVRLDGSSERLPVVKTTKNTVGILFLALGCFAGILSIVRKVISSRKLGLR